MSETMIRERVLNHGHTGREKITLALNTSGTTQQAHGSSRFSGCGFCTKVASQVGFIDQKTGNPPDIKNAEEGYALIDKIQQLKRWLHAVEYTAIAETTRKTLLQQHPKKDPEEIDTEFLGSSKANWDARTLYATMSARLGLEFAAARRQVRDALYLTTDLQNTLGSLRSGELSLLQAQEIAFQHNAMKEHAKGVAELQGDLTPPQPSQEQLSLDDLPRAPEPAEKPAQPVVPEVPTKELEAELLHAAKHFGGRKFKNHARQVRQRQLPDSGERRSRVQVQKRFLSISSAGDGMGRISGYLPLERLAMLDTQLESRSRGILSKTALRSGRSHKQVKADEFLKVLAAGLGEVQESPDENFGCTGTSQTLVSNSSGQQVLEGLEDFSIDEGPATADKALKPSPVKGQRAKIVVTIPVELLIASGGFVPADVLAESKNLHPQLKELAKYNAEKIQNGQSPCIGKMPYGVPEPTISGYGPISPQAALELALQTQQWMTLITNPVTGMPVGLGKKNYRPSQQMKTLIELRDQYCRVPDCLHPACSCEVDHVEDWAKYGGTDLPNLSSLCHEHHMLKTSGAWKVRQDKNGDPGDLEIELPDGTKIFSPVPEFEAGKRWQGKQAS